MGWRALSCPRSQEELAAQLKGIQVSSHLKACLTLLLGPGGPWVPGSKQEARASCLRKLLPTAHWAFEGRRVRDRVGWSQA